ncbi:MAG: lytic transglycosylase domain-containing protein [Desulfobacteraceae bacterium]|nr:MAG: lytic transglycosylase domain-containing protein [Desulfobacteraceae bacterium]
MRLKLIKILLCAFVFFSTASEAVSAPDSVVASEGGPKLDALLQKASDYEASTDGNDGYWRAAALYCEACRLGSTEAQYRLGMLYAFGKGVPENRAYAASMFSVASQQGHAKAFDMLETVNFKSQELPPCVTSDTFPEKLPPPPVVETIITANDPIDLYLGSLPGSKSWIIELANKISGWYGIDPKLVLSIITIESEFEPKARSHKSAMGLMQLIPATAERFNVKNAFNASQNIRGGIEYLKWLLSYYRGSIELTTAAYNAGEKAVDRYIGIPPYPETREYVKRLKKLYLRSTHPYDKNITEPSPILTKRITSQK